MLKPASINTLNTQQYSWVFKDTLEVKIVHESCLNIQGISASSNFYSLEIV